MSADALRAEVARGLGERQKALSPKWFYDQRGSELFEEITRQPEYYPTRSERALLKSFAPEWITALAPRALVELGAGAAEKTRILLDAIAATAGGGWYVPVDISSAFLEDAAAVLRRDYPRLDIRPLASDISVEIPVPEELPRPAVFALLGGTIGNFSHAETTDLLARVGKAMDPGDRFLMGADLVKDVDVLERAYNDAAGVTAAFNLNMLDVLNRLTGSDFDPAGFRHLAFYNRDENRIEMHLVAERPMTVQVPGAGSFHFAEGETVRTEISRKYTRGRVEELLAAGGLEVERWVEGPTEVDRFALLVGKHS